MCDDQRLERLSPEIKGIRSKRAAGKSLSAIANGLNADRIPTAQGGQR